MSALDTAFNDTRPRVEAHPTLLELVRIAATLARAEAEIVTLQDGCALVVASLRQKAPQLRPLTRGEREIMSTQCSHTVSVNGMCFAVRSEDGTFLAVLSLHGNPPNRVVDSLHGVARLVAELLRETAVARDGLWEALVQGQRDSIMVVDHEMRVMFANRAVGNLVGRTPAELVGMSVVDLLHPDDRQAAFEAMFTLVNGREACRLFVRVRHVSGEYCPVEITGNDLTSHPSVGGTVVTLRRDGHDLEFSIELEAERGLLYAVLDQHHDGIVAIDRIGNPMLVNQAARLMHGISADQLAPTVSLDDLLVLSSDGSPVDRESHPITQIRRGRTLVGESMSLRSEGQIRHVQVSGQPVLGPGGVQLGAVIGYHDVTHALQAQRELTQRALHDQLTGLPNRRHLHEHFAVVRHRQAEGLIGLCFIDLDGFKLVNDTFGHRVGDALVRDVGARLSEELHQDVFLARVGGDEFVAVLSHVSDESVALAMAERFLNCLRRAFAVRDTEVTLSASIGLAVHDVVGFDEEMLLRDADIALYAAKARGRNRIELFDDDLAIGH